MKGDDFMNQLSKSKKSIILMLALIMTLSLLMLTLFGCNRDPDRYTTEEHIQRITRKVARNFMGEKSIYTSFEIYPMYDHNDNVCLFLVEFEPVGFIFVWPRAGRNMYWYCPSFGNHLHSVQGWAKYRFGTEENIPESFNEFNMIKDVRNYINFPSTLYFEADADGQYVYYQKSPYHVANKLNEKLYYINNAPAIKKNDKYYNLISDLWYGSYEETEKWEFMLDVDFLHKWTL